MVTPARPPTDNFQILALPRACWQTVWPDICAAVFFNWLCRSGWVGGLKTRLCSAGVKSYGSTAALVLPPQRALGPFPRRFVCGNARNMSQWALGVFPRRKTPGVCLDGAKCSHGNLVRNNLIFRRFSSGEYVQNIWCISRYNMPGIYVGKCEVFGQIFHL